MGRTVRANAEVTPSSASCRRDSASQRTMDAWLPLRIGPWPSLAVVARPSRARNSGHRPAQGQGVTLEQAQAEMAAIAGRLATEYPTNQGVGATVMRQADTFIGPDAVGMLYTMLAAVFGVLLIACANVANLLLARTVARSKEVAIRTALGANRMRTITQLLAEALVLAAAGAAVGLIVARWRWTSSTRGWPRWICRCGSSPGSSRRSWPSSSASRCSRHPTAGIIPALRLEGERRRNHERRIAGLIEPAHGAHQPGAGHGQLAVHAACWWRPA